MKAWLTVGLSAAGKTSWTNAMLESTVMWGATEIVDIDRDFIRFNIVCPGANWSNYKFTKANEAQVDEIEGKMIMDAWGKGLGIIVSNTNLNPKTRNKLAKQLEDLGYEVEIKEFPITFEEAIKRDNLRANGVGKDVIYKQWLQWNEYIGRKKYVPDVNLPKAVIYDVDNTIAEMVDRGPFDWSKVGNDKPKQFVINMLRNHAKAGYEIIICSGRSDECRYETEMWLNANVGAHYFSELHMRKKGDYRKDCVVKEEIFWEHLADKYNIEAVVDDRAQMIRLYYELGISNVISVANPYLEF